MKHKEPGRQVQSASRDSRHAEATEFAPSWSPVVQQSPQLAESTDTIFV